MELHLELLMLRPLLRLSACQPLCCLVHAAHAKGYLVNIHFLIGHAVSNWLAFGLSLKILHCHYLH